MTKHWLWSIILVRDTKKHQPLSVGVRNPTGSVICLSPPYCVVFALWRWWDLNPQNPGRLSD